MPEPTPTTPPAGTPPAGGQPPTPPTPGDNPGMADFDPSKLSDEQLSKVLEDQRLWKTQRLSELRDKAKKADQYEKDRAANEEKTLTEQKKFEELATKRQAERDEAQGRYQTAVIDNAIMSEAAKAGITDLDAAKKLIERGEIKLDENGTVSGVTEAVKTLAAAKPYLVGNSSTNTSVGGGTNPADPGTPAEFTMTQIQDPTFYRANEAAIKKALSEGKVKEDRY